MKNLLFFCLGALLFLGCQPKAQKAKVKIPSDFKVEMERLGCRGFCPAYVYTLDAQGKGTYEGRRNAEPMGKHSKTFDKSKVQEALSAINEAAFWDMQECYGCEVADLPGFRISVTSSGKTKVVTDYKNAPEPLLKLESRLEGIFGKEGWVAAQ